MLFFSANEYGPAVFKNVVESLPIDNSAKNKDVARYLGITPRLVADYLSGKAEPPRSSVMALWLESPIGRAATSAHSEQSAALWRSLAKSQADTIAALKARIDAQAGEIDALKRAATARPDSPPAAANETFFERYR